MSPRHLDLVLARPELADLDAVERRRAIRALVAEAGVDEPATVAGELADFVDGYGPLTQLMDDDEVTDILVNGPFEVWVERRGALELSGLRFAGAEELQELADLLVARGGGRVDPSRPLGDARLPDGSRIHVVLPPVAPHGPLVSIRRFRRTPFTLAGLAANGMFDEGDERRLAHLVRERANIVAAGATGTGKTTLLSALLREVPLNERVVSIEETPELRVSGAHVASLLARPPNPEGHGAIELDELLRAALRMRPDRIVVGEVRGAEALTALSALATGHSGSMITVHARSAEDVIGRLVSLALGSPGAPSEGTLLRDVRAAFDVVVWLERQGGRRKVAEIKEL